MNQMVKASLLGILAGLTGYFIVGTILFGWQSGKVLAVGVRNRMLTHPLPIAAGLVLFGAIFWYVGMRR